MLTADVGQKATRFTRDIIEAHVKQQKIGQPELPLIFQEKRGAFVTLHTYPDHELRGCIGIPQPVMSLKDALKEAAISVTKDPRFMPLHEHELSSVIVEITILTKPELIQINKPEDYTKQIKIGKDGLIIQYLGRSGLLLPQVPVEYRWDIEDFLLHLCLKAGLASDTWFNSEAKILKFSGQIFTEREPKGFIEEKSFEEI